MNVPVAQAVGSESLLEGASYLTEDTLPIRDVLFSVEHLEAHARDLAGSNLVDDARLDDERLRQRFDQNAAALEAAYSAVVDTVGDGEEITSGAEWLLDNFFVVREHVRQIREGLPRRYLRELPKLGKGPWVGLPRVYALAEEIVSHTDASLDAVIPARIVKAYQEVAPLTIGELWAVPLMLRLALIENLRRLAERIVETQRHRRCVEEWADEFVMRRSDDLATLLNERTSGMKRLSPSLAVHLIQRFRDQGRESTDCRRWLEGRLGKDAGTLDEFVHREHQLRAADQVSTGNSITAMRLISALDWTVFFDQVSLVEHELRNDPAGDYRDLDFATRDRYRHVVEWMARRSRRSELEVARQAVSAARARDGDPLRGHVGYHLIDDGRRRLEASLGVAVGPRERVRRFFASRAVSTYLTCIVGLWLVCLATLVVWLSMIGASHAAQIVLTVLFLAAAGEIAIALVNYGATRLVPPDLLPRMDFRAGIPWEHRGIVVVPTILTSRRAVEALCNRLELHYLANQEPHLSFALLTDFADADREEMPDDEMLLSEAVRRIDELNRRHRRAGGSQPFRLFHRRRCWNAAEGKWMGWERKRGKLSEFNRLLLGNGGGTYVWPQQFPDELVGTPYVITLDSDTKLPPGTARRLLSTIAHPLNAPRLDESQSYVERGYTVLQPRVMLNPLIAGKSAFARIISGNPRLDPYATASSDVYQDCFGEGSFTGKGLYVVEPFEKVLEKAFPENRILSHDLIEGCHVRAALVTDAQLIDDFPSQYRAFVRRQHRWARGDWQILPWLLPTVPNARGKGPNPLGVLCRWKIFDNLRRTLTAPTLTAFVAVAWYLVPTWSWAWTCCVFGALGLPMLLHIVSLTAACPCSRTAGRFLVQMLPLLRVDLQQIVLAAALLPHQSWVMLDAVTTTLIRMLVTRRRLLEWETAHAAEKNAAVRTWQSYLREMAIAPVLAVIVVGLLVGLDRIEALGGALPLIGLWFASPWIAHRLSGPEKPRTPALDANERRELRGIARRTWLFFETFVGADDHWLPPDNFQEVPGAVVAHRTSPTNAGLYLTAVLAARDFGYVSLDDLLANLEQSVDSWSQLEHYRGHTYNWYDTQTLRPLPPAYVSTVDSGNWAACALAVRQGLLELIDQPFPVAERFRGLVDALQMVDEATDRAADGRLGAAWRRSIERIERHRFSERDDPSALRKGQVLLSELDRELAPALTEELSDERNSEPLHPDAVRLRALRHQWTELKREFETLFSYRSAAAHGHDEVQQGGARRELEELLDRASSLAELATLDQRAQAYFDALQDDAGCAGLRERVDAAADAARNHIRRLRSLSQRLYDMTAAMDFTFLYDRQRHLFSIGFNVETSELDRGHYDLLASEARLASYLAVSMGELDYPHWFQLGRPLVDAAGRVALLSWGGTMFEYLMPDLFLQSYPETLLAQSCRAAVERQIEFGRRQHVPWGVSESAFAAFDAARNYQYRSFGVPGLGLKRGLSDDLVVAPYATGLALMVCPHEALANLKALEAEGGAGTWGFYESIDYTAARLARSETKHVVRCYFAHHQGMLFAAAANCLFENCLRRRFHREPMIHAVELLLIESVPMAAPSSEPHGHETGKPRRVREAVEEYSRWIRTPHTTQPHAHLLANGRYAVMVTNSGAGYSRCRGLQMTRWRSDGTCDRWGQFVYLRDDSRSMLWSAGYQPTCREPDDYEVLYSVDKAEFRRIDGELATRQEITVVPDDDVEVRLVSITNHGSRPRTIDVTSYAELVLGSAAADLAHPAFQKLFVETEFLAEHNALLARRRPRAATDAPMFAFHIAACEEQGGRPAVGGIQFETDRARFLGRGRSVANPAACMPGASLSGSVGAVLDPIFSLRRTVRVLPDQTVRIAFSTGFAETREQARRITDQYHDLRVVLRAFELSWAHAQVSMRHLQLTAGDVHLYQRLASLMLYPDPAKRASPTVLKANRQGQSGLWRYGISGDFPLLVVRITGADQEALVRQVLSAYEHWRKCDFAVELAILNEYPTSYIDAIQELLNRLVGERSSRSMLNQRAGIFILHGSHMPEEDRTLLLSAASAVLSGDVGSLEKQFDFRPTLTLGAAQPSPPVRSRRIAKRPETQRPAKAEAPQPTEFANGFGAFERDGAEYVVRLTDGGCPPAPWSNVIANESFGCLATDLGGGYTWSENSRNNRLTSWSNDAVSDTPSEALYLRDELTGEITTPTPLPVRDTLPYAIRHGLGYTIFQHESLKLSQTLSVSVAAAEPVKIIRLTVKNLSNQIRQLSATYYVDWVLGVVREQTELHVITAVDADRVLTARNPYNREFPDRVAFLHVVGRPQTVMGDRREFLGRNGHWSSPAALKRDELSGMVGAGFDPGGAVQTKFQLEPGEETEVVFLLGQVAAPEQLAPLLARYERPEAIAVATAENERRMRDDLQALQVKTPNRAFDILVNHWLLNQTLSSRFWARTAFYQSSGAYGFRDQLQDCLALVYARPALVRKHLLRAASRQFEQGDVQHWWHPPLGQGVRTRFSDDFLWLPFVTSHYVRVTGDVGVLDEVAPFLHSAPLEPAEEERYELPGVSSKSATLYEHCLAAIENGRRYGRHGLPLIGCGDWNDGMNKIGVHGRGESVWVAWFQIVLLEQFAQLAVRRGEEERAVEFHGRAEQLRRAVEETSWDGAWYRRAYFDDGTPLGSAQNDACRIDSITQSWAVFARADAARTRTAMQSVFEQLVRLDDRIILLFTPPFEETQLEPGYIKGYVPGVRENGGQYTHAALWVVQAFAELGDGDRAMQMFDLINPILHADRPERAEIYQVEPYVVAADVYGRSPHIGRGGWTWYTGSAAWMYRIAVESLLGFRLHGDTLRVQPRMPENWPGFELIYRYRSSTYQIVVERDAAANDQRIYVDEEPISGLDISLVDDGRAHHIRIFLKLP